MARLTKTLIALSVLITGCDSEELSTNRKIFESYNQATRYYVYERFGDIQEHNYIASGRLGLKFSKCSKIVTSAWNLGGSRSSEYMGILGADKVRRYYRVSHNNNEIVRMSPLHFRSGNELKIPELAKYETHASVGTSFHIDCSLSDLKRYP